MPFLKRRGLLLEIILHSNKGVDRLSAFSPSTELLDALVLAVLAQEDTYGYKITKEIGAHFLISESTLYPVLRRLKKNGNLTTYDAPYQGRNRRYYHLTDAGQNVLEQYRSDWAAYAQQVTFFLERRTENDNTGIL